VANVCSIVQIKPIDFVLYRPTISIEHGGSSRVSFPSEIVYSNRIAASTLGTLKCDTAGSGSALAIIEVKVR